MIQTLRRALTLVLIVAAQACSAAPAAAPASAPVTATSGPAAAAATVAKPSASSAPAGAGPTVAPNAAPKPAAVASGKVTFAYSQDFNTLDPALISATNEFSLMKSVDPGLVARNGKGETCPAWPSRGTRSTTSPGSSNCAKA